MMKIVKAIDEKRLHLIEALYLEAFPEAERKPFQMMVQKQSEGTMEILSIEEENSFLGLAIFAFDKDLALLDYFAISSQIRGQGMGSRAIRSLQKIYSGKRMILEIETTKKSGDHPEMREHRKKFYERNGFHTMDFDVNFFGVEMEIMANCENLTFEEYLDIYKNACGKKYADKVFLVEQAEEKQESEEINSSGRFLPVIIGSILLVFVLFLFLFFF